MLDLLLPILLGYLGIGLGAALISTNEWNSVGGFLYYVIFWVLELR
jgi:hypothetical protein